MIGACVFSMLWVAGATALPDWNTTSADCVAPGTCTPPNLPFSRVVPGPAPGQQWNINGGFCGSFSVQQCGLAFGAWISQDLVRKANRDQTGIPHNMHGDTTVGYEVVPSNVAYTAEHLKLTYSEWDYSQPAPQAQGFKKWIKYNLVKGSPVVWFPMCKGDSHSPYAGSCPNGGHIDHVEPMYGIFSSHTLDQKDDAAYLVYDDDVIVHASDQDYLPYYRPIASLEDTPSMDGNCLHAQPGFGKNEMYPCFDDQVTYGLAVTGLAVKGSLPVSLIVDITAEPNVRSRLTKPVPVHGTAMVSGLTKGNKYTLYRYGSTADLPSAPPFNKTNAEFAVNFEANGDTWNYTDPNPFMSNTATYYVCAPSN